MAKSELERGMWLADCADSTDKRVWSSGLCSTPFVRFVVANRGATCSVENTKTRAHTKGEPTKKLHMLMAFSKEKKGGGVNTKLSNTPKKVRGEATYSDSAKDNLVPELLLRGYYCVRTFCPFLASELDSRQNSATGAGARPAANTHTPPRKLPPATQRPTFCRSRRISFRSEDCRAPRIAIPKRINGFQT